MPELSAATCEVHPAAINPGMYDNDGAPSIRITTQLPSTAPVLFKPSYLATTIFVPLGQ
ncbi:hypothetical protein [Flavobacterium sp.]|uniref:hypothetical protein n=1 Tax=Flavobacterium sp. TaxID=239 RepID=UPI0039E48328